MRIVFAVMESNEDGETIERNRFSSYEEAEAFIVTCMEYSGCRGDFDMWIRKVYKSL